MLAGGETSPLRFRLRGQEIDTHHEQGRYVLAPGVIAIYLGSSFSAEAKTRITLTKS